MNNFIEVNDRILYIIENKTKSNKKKFAEIIGFAPQVISNIVSGRKSKPSYDVLNAILSSFDDVSAEWLLTGEGSMLKSEEITTTDITDGVPFWNLPVSAGKSVADVVGGFAPDGYIKGLPGADISENILPVTGTSMEPEISAGALIGIRKVNNWETLNTERIYFIITQDDRMIKRIEPDTEDDSILWCVSPNYPKFKLYKADIIEIQRVCFVYNPK